MSIKEKFHIAPEEESRIISNINSVPLIEEGHIIKSNKWLLVSGLQKAIRRGHSESAIACALSVGDIDPAYLSWRLKIIASEDVSTGNIDVSNSIIYLCNNYKDYNDFVVRAASLCRDAALGVKDHCAHNISRYLSAKGDVYVPSLEMAGNPIDLFYSSDDIYMKCFILWRLVGTKLIKSRSFSFEEDFDLLSELLNSIDVDDSYKSHFILSLIGQKEYHFISSIVVAMAYKKTKSKKKRVKLSNKLENGIVISAYDGHTSIGKKRIWEYIENNEKLRNYLDSVSSSRGEAVSIFGEKLFMMDSGRLNHYISSPVERLSTSMVVGLKMNRHSYVNKFVEEYIANTIGVVRDGGVGV